MKYLRIAGTDFNATIVSQMKFEEFKKEGEHSFSIGKSDEQLKEIHGLLIKAAKPKEDGNTKTVGAKSGEPEGQGRTAGSSSNADKK